MTLMSLDGYQARITYNPESDQFRGEILGLSGGAEFYGSNPDELRREFKQSLEVYLEVCRERGIAPRKQFSGKFNLRIPPDLHEQLSLEAEAQGKSLNALALEALQNSLSQPPTAPSAGYCCCRSANSQAPHQGTRAQAREQTSPPRGRGPSTRPQWAEH